MTSKSQIAIAHISDYVYYWDGDTWYTPNGFPLEDLADATKGAVTTWTFFGRLQKVGSPPTGALAIRCPPWLKISFVGPELKRRGIGGYLVNLPEYLRILRGCVKNHDILWLKANFVAAWLALPFLWRSRALRVSHQIGDPAQIAVGPPALLRVITLFATVMTRIVNRLADINVFVSQDLANHYAHTGRQPWICNENRIKGRQIINVASLRERLQRPVKLIYVGRLSPEKGIPILLRAAKKICFDYELRVVGDGQQRVQLERLVSDLGLVGKVEFLGAIPWGSPLFALMRDSDILILPSYTEGLGLVLLEAMSQGLSVVASNVGGIPEIVRNEVTGLLFPAGNIDALASAISRLVADDALRVELKRNALVLARQNTIDRQLGNMMRCVVSRFQETR
jgi:glycosyltransferase involved in cell wall biosynthesis